MQPQTPEPPEEKGGIVLDAILLAVAVFCALALFALVAAPFFM